MFEKKCLRMVSGDLFNFFFLYKVYYNLVLYVSEKGIESSHMKQHWMRMDTPDACKKIAAPREDTPTA